MEQQPLWEHGHRRHHGRVGEILRGASTWRERGAGRDVVHMVIPGSATVDLQREVTVNP